MVPVPIQGQMGQFQRSCASAGYQSELLAPGRNRSCPAGCGREGLDSPCTGPCWVIRVSGTAGAVSEARQETSHPHSIQPLSLSPCSLSHCLSLCGFPAHCRFQLWCFPGKPSCWQTGWVSAGIAPAKDRMGLRMKAGPAAGQLSLLGAAAHPRGSRSPGHHSCPG